MTAPIPIPTAPARTRRSSGHDDIDPQFITLDEAETLALATGQHRGMTVTFSDDGQTWVEAWMPSDGHTAPEFARAVVIRKWDDRDVPTVSTLRWAEYVPDMESPRYEEWTRMPTMYLGKCAKVSAYRGGFRDVIGNRYEPAELDQTTRAPLAITA